MYKGEKCFLVYSACRTVLPFGEMLSVVSMCHQSALIPMWILIFALQCGVPSWGEKKMQGHCVIYLAT